MTYLILVLCLSVGECRGHEVALWWGDQLDECHEVIEDHALGFSAYCEVDLDAK